MNSFNTLKKVLYKLKKEEIKSLINFIEYHRDFTGQKLKSVQLIESAMANRTISSPEMQLKLYGKLNYSAFNKLIIRLKDKIYEVLLFNSNLNNSESYGKRNQTIFDLRKRLLQSEIMFSRGMNEDLISMLNKIVERAKEYETYDTLLEALHAKQRYVGFRSGFSANQKIKLEIDQFEKVRGAYNRALEIYNSISSKIQVASSSTDYEEELNEAILVLKKDYEFSNSALIGYYYFFLLTEYFQNRSDLVSARRTLEQLKELLDQNISVYTRNRKGNVLINIANNEFLMFSFRDCLLNAKEASKYLSESAVNSGIIKEFEFNVLFHTGELDQAEQLLEELFRLSRTTSTPFLYARRAYLLACLKTLNREFEKSKELLSEVSEIEKDKEGWNIGKRILTIINRIETNDFESVDLKVQNLEKHIKRTLKTKHVRKRNILIFRILLKLINDQFDFKKVYRSRQRYFNLLESNDADYRWQIKSPELIVFHEWFRGKMEDRPYDHKAAIEREKEKQVAAMAG